MSKKDEALKLALEALEDISALQNHSTGADSSDADKAITAIREALAEQTYPDNFIHALMYDVAKRDSEALAEQPAQQVLEHAPCQGMNCGITRTDQEHSMECQAEHAAAIAGGTFVKPAQQQEPVALPEKIYEFVPTPEPAKWHHPECEGECIACLIERVVQEAYGSQGLGYLQRHLTSPPAQRKPLTDEQREEIAKKWRGRNWTVGDIIDAIEAAHGIKENNHE